MSAINDGSESVDQFLARIASIKEPRDQANEERTKRIEEDFVKNRKERQARRLERARSLSPSKTGPARSSSTIASPAPSRQTALNPPIDFSPRSSTLTRSNAVRTSPTLEPKQVDLDALSPSFPSPDLTTTTPTSLSRSGTLSWQQRRTGREDTLSRPRPLSTIENVRIAAKEDLSPSASPKERSRQEIAASLASKDPLWFRQTQERGTGSAAFRKHQVEDTPPQNPTLRTMRLPGLSQDDSGVAKSTGIALSQGLAREKPQPEKQEGLTQSFAASRTPMGDTLKEEPLSLDPPQAVNNGINLGASLRDQPSSVSSSMARSPSPTKGLGGFVQSAMMKRSDSVNKRWSVQANSGLKRGDSVAGNRSLPSVAAMHKPTISRDATSSPTATPKLDQKTSKIEPLSRSDMQPLATPHDTEVKTQHTPDIFKPKEDSTQLLDLDEDVLSRSPSKTMDPRRWSPTKSSWLESTLLSQSEPMKVVPKKEEQPQWMVNLQRTRSTKDTSAKASPEIVQQQASTVSSSPKRLTQISSPEEKGTSKPSIAQKKQGMETPFLNTAESNKLSQSQETRGDVGLSALTDAAKVKDFQKEAPSKIETEPAVMTRTQNLPSPASATETRKPPPQKPSVKSPLIRPTPPSLDDKKLTSKPKPQTPPKIDFRATLKSRAPPSNDDKDSEPEFKAIFGKLKSAQTKNYVAPDELKNNILTGKAALNTTGGPQKPKRVDEFKESILQKKEAMKASAEQSKHDTLLKTSTPKPEAPLPEALARRKTLHRATPSTAKEDMKPDHLPNLSKSTSNPIVQPISTIKGENLVSSPIVDVGNRKPPPLQDGLVAQRARPSTDQSFGMMKTTELNKPSITIDQPKQLPKETSGNVQSFGTSSKSAEVLGPSNNSPPKAELPPGSKLASRLNPNLAALLSRTTSPLLEAKEPLSLTGTTVPSGATSTPKIHDKEHTSNELTHATKARAKGPKRRAPKTQTAVMDNASSESRMKPAEQGTSPSKQALTSLRTVKQPVLVSADTGVKSSIDAVANATSLPSTPIIKFSKLRSTDPAVQSTPIASNTEIAAKEKVRPTIAAKSPELRRVSSSLTTQLQDGPPTQSIRMDEADLKSPASVTGSAPASGSTPKKNEVDQKPANATNTMPPLTPRKPWLNTPKETDNENLSAKKPSSSSPKVGLGLDLKPKPIRIIKPDHQQTPPQTPPSMKSQSLQRSEEKHDLFESKKINSIVQQYFTTIPTAGDKLEFDTHALLSTKTTLDQKYKTTSKSIWEITTGGKKNPIPVHQEHILYEDSLYLIVHTFETPTSNKTSEVYLWCGDGVAEGAIEDAQLFCRKEAREHNVKLEIIQQGKEHAKLFQALGGIVITRRNKSSALYMLCGRKHIGHVAFDEVDFITDNLCSGFTYLISSRYGRLILWKGQGATVDEVGCARLIGMDLGLTGEIEEVEEGAETTSFWDAFPQPSTRAAGTEKWVHRAEHDGYPCNLYHISRDRPKSSGGFWGLRATSPPKASDKAAIELLDPLSHRSLVANNIYILDAYCSVYVLVLSAETSQITEFVTALHLAQEIAMLSPSIQDRSLLPSCFVVFGDPITDVKACFRKWAPEMLGSKESACIKLEDVMQALNL